MLLSHARDPWVMQKYVHWGQSKGKCWSEGQDILKMGRQEKSVTIEDSKDMGSKGLFIYMNSYIIVEGYSHTHD